MPPPHTMIQVGGNAVPQCDAGTVDRPAHLTHNAHGRASSFSHASEDALFGVVRLDLDVQILGLFGHQVV